jgi:hypothetical protein
MPLVQCTNGAQARTNSMATIRGCNRADGTVSYTARIESIVMERKFIKRRRPSRENRPNPRGFDDVRRSYPRLMHAVNVAPRRKHR